MKFTLAKTQTGKILQGSDPEVYVKFQGFLPGRQVWILFKGDKRIGVFTDQETTRGDNYSADRSDYKITHWILSVGESVPPDIGPYKFQSVEEQDEILDLLKDAFAVYAAGVVEPKNGVEVRFHKVLKSRISKGLNISK